eukprot:SAG31_NODE_4315_length_3365_cov_1.038579_3_plen_43_part_00
MASVYLNLGSMLGAAPSTLLLLVIVLSWYRYVEEVAVIFGDY